ncbi:MAG TPA: GAF domain-containing protein [Ktedonobacterales bacterium]|nr:GAF domain-containing protein [Ktedonobacterales bacterium]
MFDTLFDMLPAPCAECQRLLAMSPLSELPAPERTRAERHLETCERCRHASASFAHTDALVLQTLKDEPPEEVLKLLAPEALAAIRTLPAERAAASPQAELLARLRAAAAAPQQAPAPQPAVALAAPVAAPRLGRTARLLQLIRWVWAAAHAFGAALRQHLASLWLRLAYGPVRAQSPVPSYLLTAQFRPRHRLRMHLMLRNFDLISGALLTFIIAALVWPIAWQRPAYWLWPVGMCLYTAVRARAIRSTRFRAWYAFWINRRKRGLHALAGRQRPLRSLQSVQEGEISQLLHLALAFGLLCMALLFSISIHLSGQASLLAESTAWLLFCLPILWLSRYSSTGWIVAMTGLTTAFNVVLLLITDRPFWPNGVVPVLVQTAWIIILCMLPTILARYAAEISAGMHAAVDVVKEIARIRDESVEEFANVAAAIIARRMNYEHVNILETVASATSLASERHDLRLIGAASPRGRQLARQGFTLPFGTGVCGRAAAYRRDQLMNDVTGAAPDIYVAQEDFRDTLAELAIPILCGNELLGVLDLQATVRYAFSEYDVLLLRAVVTHLGVALQHLRTKQVCGLTAATAASGAPAATTQQPDMTTAAPVVHSDTHRDVRPLLEEIASVIRGVLGADLVVLYPTCPTAPSAAAATALDPDEPIKLLLEEPIWEGVLRTRVGSAASFTRSLSRSAVGQVLLNNDALFIDDAPHRAELIARDHVRQEKSFVEREGVLAVAALPLIAHADQSGGDPAEDLVGVMFVNFRRAHRFTDQEEIWCRSLAHLAGLALLNSRQFQRNPQAHRRAYDRLRGVSDNLAKMQSHAALLICQAGDETSGHASVSAGW